MVRKHITSILGRLERLQGQASPSGGKGQLGNVAGCVGAHRASPASDNSVPSAPLSPFRLSQPSSGCTDGLSRSQPGHMISTSLFPCNSASHQDGAPGGASPLQEQIILVNLPQLSPNMKNGKIRKWLKQPGDEIGMYDVIFELDTDNLSEEGYRVGNLAGTVTMLVEAQEEGFLTDVLVQEGELVEIHTPVAVMCESETSPDELADQRAQVQKLIQNHRESLKTLTWQSYLKESTGKKGCS